MRRLFVSIVLGLVAASGCSKESVLSGDVHGPLAEMTLEEVDKGIQANTLTAIDCNGDKTRAKHGTLPGAVLVTDDEAYSPSELPADKSRKLVFYCSGPS